jgi:dCMP deaminase
VKDKFISFYFDIAERVSELSYANRLKVGAVIVKDDRILSYGYNGTPAGFDNSCETELNGDLVTKPEVIHAEQNAILKIARHGDSSSGATLFITHAPCVDCAKLILQSGISRVYYRQDYRSTAGIDLLRKSNFGILVTKI